MFRMFWDVCPLLVQLLHLLIQKTCSMYSVKFNKSELHLNAAQPQDTLTPAAYLATGKSCGREPSAPIKKEIG